MTNTSETSDIPISLCCALMDHIALFNHGGLSTIQFAVHALVHTHCWQLICHAAPTHQEKFKVRYPAQGHFDS